MINIVKKVAIFATGMGVSQVVKNVLTSTTPKDLDKIAKISTYLGGIAVTAVMGKLASDYVENEIDGIIEIFENFKIEEIQGE